MTKGWYRRFLPHCDESGIFQFITYRLADSIPATLLAQIEEETQAFPPERMDSERRRKMEALLDMGCGSGVLRDPHAAQCILENWLHFEGRRYDLIAGVVMPTHVHLMIRPMEAESLPRIVQSWKSYTGKRLKAMFPHASVGGRFWMREYWDRYIRDKTHFRNTVDYIRRNPVKAGLVKTPDEWPYQVNSISLGTPSSLGSPNACSETASSESTTTPPSTLGTPSACSE